MVTENKSSPWWQDKRFADTLRKREAAAQPGQEEIRRLAYEIYLSRSGAPGDAVSDWLEAEDRLRATTDDD